MKQCFKPELITFNKFSERHKKQRKILSYFVFSFFLLTTVFGFFLPVCAQNIPLQQTLIVMEERDYTFAFGLYYDGLYQPAGRQFQTFASLSPDNFKKQVDAFHSAECFFQSVILSIRYADLSNSGKVDIESDRRESHRNRIYLGIKSVDGLTIF